MPEQIVVLIALGPLLLLIAGAAVLAVQGRIRRVRERPEPLVAALGVLGWTLLLVGLFALVAVLTHFFFIAAWIVTAVVLLAIQHQYRRMELRSLIWVLTAAAERGIPLEAAARDFAEKRCDWIGGRALDLAEYLEAGLPLSLAAERARLPLPAAILLAADVGQQTGQLGPALRQALRGTDATELVMRSTTEELFYVTILAVFGLSTWGFVMIKIVPAFAKIFQDFGMHLPPITLRLIEVSVFVCNYGVWCLLPVIVLGAVFLISGVLYYVGATPRVLPLFGRLGMCADSAVVMRWLAVAVRQNRPIADMIRLLVGYFPRRSVRRKLERTAKRIDQGASWSGALFQAGLIRRPEVAVFNAAERAGNLAWALDEMAESSLRRAVYRLRAALGVLFPVVVLLFGGVVFVVALGTLSPLFTLIRALAS